ncbi:MAG TPA: hypothetical protein VGA19_06255, partial [Rhodospirillales bacterium]
ALASPFLIGLTDRFDPRRIYLANAALGGMGESNAVELRRRGFTRRATLAAAADRYRALFGGADGRVNATFQMVTLTGWAPDPSQPHALRPGSAAGRLADALGTDEVSLGEKAKP